MAELRHKRSFGSWVKRMSSSSARSWSGQPSSKKSGGVFGVPLIESVCYARSTVGYVDEEAVKHRRAGIVPLIVAKCGSFLKTHALHTEGVFRKSGGMKRVAALQSIFDDPHESYGLHLNWLGYTIHDAANILCRYLQRLPEPVIPHAFYESFRDVMSDRYYQKTEDRIQAFQALVKRLPIPHQHLLLYLLDLLSLFASHEHENRMSGSNLAVVFGPSILRHPRHNDPIQHRISQRVLEFLIEFQALFTMKMLNRKHPVLPYQQQQQQQQPPPPVPPLPSQQQQQQQLSTVAPPELTWPVRLPSPPPDAAFPGNCSTRNTSSDDRSTPQPYPYQHDPPEARTTSASVSTLSAGTKDTLDPSSTEEQENTPLRRLRLLQSWLAHYPYGFWPCMAAFCGILGTYIYEAYQATQCCRLEPYVFFIGCVIYWALLIQGITWPETAGPADDDDLQLSLFDDISEQAKDDDEVMLRDIACEWHSLFNRSWRDQQHHIPIEADQMSIMSAASRFDEEESAGLTSGEEDGDKGDGDISFDIASVELQTMWKRQQDADQLADLQQEEEWKIRHYSQPH